MLSDFHFLSPAWFLALLPLGAVLWGISRRGTGAAAWQRVVDPKLLPHLLIQRGGRGRRLPLALLAIGWLAAVVALADPTFERLPVPVYRGELARVVVLDLSRSMEAADLKPSRLTRARYKVADILERSRDGQVGLVAFAGDAFVVSPLTDDADTVLAMLDVMVPEIMPVQGSRPDLALAKAMDLLSRAGVARGEVVLVGDDAGDARALTQAKALKAAGSSLSVIGTGTAEGAPVPGVRDANDRAVISRLDADALRTLAAAGGGAYAPLSADDRDLDRTLPAKAAMPDEGHGGAGKEAQMQTEVWNELGPWVVLGVLPLAALAFRRGWLLVLALLIGSWAWVPEPAVASLWDDLWQRRDQQAAAALERGEHEKARDLAEQPERRAAASYRLGDYQAAAEDLAGVDQADAHYNRGNALAQAGRLEEAIAAYEQALAQEPEMEDAAFNQSLVEGLLKKQRQEQQSHGAGQNGQQGEGSQEQESQGRQPEGQPAGGPEGQEQSQGGDQAAGDESSQDGRSAGRDQGRREDQGPAEAQAQEEAEQAAAAYRKEAEKQGAGQVRDEQPPSQGPGNEEPGPEEREARQAADQWLRRVPDDPAGLLRRKFLYQYRSRTLPEGGTASGDPW